jgi:hypothetical protein
VSKAEPTLATVKRLFAVSGNRCAFPTCTNPIVGLAGEPLGEICHIEAESARGPRYNPDQTDEQRRGFDNLILLCSIHHTTIDSDVNTYTVPWLQGTKRRHEARYPGSAEPFPRRWRRTKSARAFARR